MRFTTEFMNGPNGFLLESTKTWPATSTASDGEATFAYTYQTVQGFQLPSLVTVTASTSETWYYDLTDCKAMTGITLNVGRLGADCVQYPLLFQLQLIHRFSATCRRSTAAPCRTPFNQDANHLASDTAKRQAYLLDEDDDWYAERRLPDSFPCSNSMYDTGRAVRRICEEYG